MKIEEKARAYDEALKKARFYHGNCPSEPERKKLERMFPVLRESEDERARKELISQVEKSRHHPADKARWIAYLEKQKEPHYTKRNALFDKCVENCDPEVMKRVSDEVDEMLEKERKQVENPKKGCPTYPLSVVGDLLAKTPQEPIEFVPEQKPAEFTHHETNESLKDAVTHQMEDDGDIDDFVRKGIDDVVLKYAELGAKWQKEQKPAEWGDYKDKVNVPYCSSEPEWSEEDEKMLRTIISDGSRGVELDSKQISWLKSLRPSWKPSEEQMEALNALNLHGDLSYVGQQNQLISLYQDLKKLM